MKIVKQLEQELKKIDKPNRWVYECREIKSESGENSPLIAIDLRDGLSDKALMIGRTWWKFEVERQRDLSQFAEFVHQRMYRTMVQVSDKLGQIKEMLEDKLDGYIFDEENEELENDE